MTSSFPHRFARVFREVTHEQPEIPLQDQFHLAYQRLNEHKINSLLAHCNTLPSGSYLVRRSDGGSSLQPG
jgi:hypothetical protein